MMKYVTFLVLAIVLGLWGVGCRPIEKVPTFIKEVEKPRDIIFLGHPYDWQGLGDRSDPWVEALDLTVFDNIWLGGDVTRESTREKSIVEYVDSLYMLDDPNNFWAMGNHDMRNGNWEWIEEVTGRSIFFTHHHKGLTVISLNSYITPDIACEEVDKQSAMINLVLDTITQSSHLVILSHHLVWGHVDLFGMNAWRYANSTRANWRSRCTDSLMSQFHHAIYPRLVEIQNRGIQVICIAGDMGVFQKKFQFLSKEGVWFLGSGINNSVQKDSARRTLLPPDQVIHLRHDPLNRTLEWQFRSLRLLKKK